MHQCFGEQMKIHSKFTDYYDGVLLSFEPEAKIWARATETFRMSQKHEGKEKTLQLVDALCRSTHNDLKSTGRLLSFVVIAGKTYPVMIVTAPFPEKYKILFGWEQAKQMSFYKKWKMDLIPRDVPVEVHAELNSPVFEIVHADTCTDFSYQYYTHWDLQGHVGLSVVVNPRLHDICQTVLPATQLAQTIEHYMYNEMVAVNTVAPLPITDVEKAESKGFDKKISFRHRK